MVDTVPNTAGVDGTGKVEPRWWIPSVFGITVLAVLVVTTFFIQIKADDIWWHLKTGEYILNFLSLPNENIFSFTAPDHEWLPHEWLSEVVFFWLYDKLGPRGLIAFGILLNALACGLVFKLTVRYSRSPYVTSLITFLAALMMLGNFSLRPYLFGNLFFVCTLHAMEEPAAGGKLRPVLIFLLFAGWANFHGSFMIGLALILLYIAASVTSRMFGGRLAPGGKKKDGTKEARPKALAKSKSFLLDFGVALAACIVTPNHVFGLIFPLTYVQKAFSGEINYLTNISEWQPAGFSTPLGQMITFYLMFCGFALMGSRRSPKPVHIGLLVAFATFAFTSIRNIPLLGIAATPVLARHLPHTFGRTWRAITRRGKFTDALNIFHRRITALDKRSKGILLPILGIILLLGIFIMPPSSPFSYSAMTRVEHLHDLSPGFYPRGVLDDIAERGGNHRIFNYFNWGGAFIWRLYPQERVFIDQRNDCYPIEVFRDYFAVHRLERDWSAVLDRWNIDFVAYPVDSRVTKALEKDPGWKAVYTDHQAALYSRVAQETAVDKVATR